MAVSSIAFFSLDVRTLLAGSPLTAAISRRVQDIVDSRAELHAGFRVANIALDELKASGRCLRPSDSVHQVVAEAGGEVVDTSCVLTEIDQKLGEIGSDNPAQPVTSQRERHTESCARAAE